MGFHRGRGDGRSHRGSLWESHRAAKSSEGPFLIRLELLRGSSQVSNQRLWSFHRAFDPTFARFSCLCNRLHGWLTIRYFLGCELTADH